MQSFLNIADSIGKTDFDVVDDDHSKINQLKSEIYEAITGNEDDAELVALAESYEPLASTVGRDWKSKLIFMMSRWRDELAKAKYPTSKH